MMESGINFDLKSEEEQNIILYSFQDLLNTLDFSIQVLIHSRKVNIEPYLQRLRERKKLEENELLKVQIDEYAEFIKSFVADNAIMIKTFFIVVPYEVIRLPTQKETAETYRKNLEQLNQRVDEVTIGLQRISLLALPLKTDELTELF